MMTPEQEALLDKYFGRPRATNEAQWRKQMAEWLGKVNCESLINQGSREGWTLKDKES